MAITINWATKVIDVPRADMALVQSSPTEVRELDLNTFRLALKDIEDSEDGIVHATTHSHNPPVSVGGVTLARVVELINGYTVTFEDGQYAVNLAGANSNVGDNVNVNQVSVRSANAAGLIQQDELDSLKYQVESLRQTHQGFGSAFYVSSSAGSDSNQGTSPASPKRTIASALASCVSGRGDVIYLISPSAGVEVFAENVTISSEDVHIRGPGRGAQIQPSSGVPITIDANNCSVRGLIVRAPAGSTATDCVVINGKYSELQRLYVVGTETGTGNGVVYRGGDYHEQRDMEVEKCGGSGVKTVDAGLASGAPREITLYGGNYYLNKRDGVELTSNTGGTPGASTRILRVRGANIHNNTRYGISIDSNTTNVVVDEESMLHENGAGHILDDGPSTSVQSEVHKADVSDAVWSHAAGTAASVKLALIERILRNKTITDPNTGVMTVYADDNVTPLLTANLKEDAAGSQQYRGQGAERRERLQ